jgi:hypothetical protein
MNQEVPKFNITPPVVLVEKKVIPSSNLDAIEVALS